MDKKKLGAAAVTVVAAAVIALTGTFAWQSISQGARNGTFIPSNPGGRLHDDFDGVNKAVYAENFTDPEDGMDVFVRIRLDEYLETGRGAGLMRGDEGYDKKEAIPLVFRADINDPTTWTTFNPNGDPATDPFRAYFIIDVGKTEGVTYMPTFNKNKDSLRADINGSFDEIDPDTGRRYADYRLWKAGETKTGKAEYDMDENNDDEGEEGVEGENYRYEDETHTAGTTPEGRMIPMAAWLELSSEEEKTGPFWVYDDDGWAYWAQPLAPGEVTGPLVSAVRPANGFKSDCYYGINAVGQFITAGDLGSADAEEGHKGFYTDGAPTGNALTLLKKIGAMGESSADIEVQIEMGDPATAEKGDPSFIWGTTYIPMTGTVYKDGVLADDQRMAWSLVIEPADVGGFSIDSRTGEVAVTHQGVLALLNNQVKRLDVEGVPAVNSKAKTTQDIGGVIVMDYLAGTFAMDVSIADGSGPLRDRVVLAPGESIDLHLETSLTGGSWAWGEYTGSSGTVKIEPSGDGTKARIAYAKSGKVTVAAINSTNRVMARIEVMCMDPSITSTPTMTLESWNDGIGAPFVVELLQNYSKRGIYVERRIDANPGLINCDVSVTAEPTSLSDSVYIEQEDSKTHWLVMDYRLAVLSANNMASYTVTMKEPVAGKTATYTGGKSPSEDAPRITMNGQPVAGIISGVIGERIELELTGGNASGWSVDSGKVKLVSQAGNKAVIEVTRPDPGYVAARLNDDGSEVVAVYVCGVKGETGEVRIFPLSAEETERRYTALVLVPGEAAPDQRVSWSMLAAPRDCPGIAINEETGVVRISGDSPWTSMRVMAKPKAYPRLQEGTLDESRS